jgi:hypothetical protein
VHEQPRRVDLGLNFLGQNKSLCSGTTPRMRGGDNGGLSRYEMLLEQERQDKLLKKQITRHGEEEIQARPLLSLGLEWTASRSRSSHT